ncbi:hypothetical protein [Flavobacterium cerinum]|uniref:Uncharacterized protein n=1 Tax=Flavobacterium cerinum TaxID=2502784 RepID=A0ABY5IVN9_9FLAO|nr:hypothetical protein [Flavobacterium cerinum]UUC45587.1 hypothetical protein NOX80_18445 [Flavobacterium cerinum]
MIGVIIPEETGGVFQKPREIVIGTAFSQRGRNLTPQSLLNALSIEVRPDDIIILTCYIKKANANDSSFRIITESRFLDLDPGYYESVGDETEWNYLPLNSRESATVAEVQQDNSVTYNLGVISESVYDVINNSITQFNMSRQDRVYLIKTRQDGVDYLYMFAGEPGIYGSEFNQLNDEDLVLIYRSDISSDFPDFSSLPVFSGNTAAIDGGLHEGDPYLINDSGDYHLSVVKEPVEVAELQLEFEPVEGYQWQRIMFENYRGQTMSAVIDWGDGQTDLVNNNDFVRLEHNYDLSVERYNAALQITNSQRVNSLSIGLEAKEPYQRLTKISGLGLLRNCEQLNFHGSPFIVFDYLSLPAKTIYLNLADCSLEQSSIDGVLSMLVGYGLTNGYARLNGNNSPPGTSGQGHKNTLLTRGWIVQTE